jgi:hypothetical protein
VADAKPPYVPKQTPYVPKQKVTQNPNYTTQAMKPAYTTQAVRQINTRQMMMRQNFVRPPQQGFKPPH